MTVADDVTTDAVVFDAEPLVAYFCDEPGSDTVEEYLHAVEGTLDGYVSTVTLAEIHYIVHSIVGERHANTAVGSLEESGIRRVDAGEVWPTAAEFKHRHSPSLGDAFVLATADHVDATLLAGADDDFDRITDPPIVRFRTDPV